MFLEPRTFAQIWQRHGCFAYELKGKHELMKINIEDLVNKSFEGSCVVEVSDGYWNARKTIILSVHEIVVKGPIFPCKVVCKYQLNIRIRRRVYCQKEEALQIFKFAIPTKKYLIS